MGINLTKVQYIYRPDILRQNSLGLSIYTKKKNEGQTDKIGLFWGEHKGKVNEDEYGGFILYSFMKREE
jgi:hypothetical protein